MKKPQHMMLELLRIVSGSDSTLGILYDVTEGRKFMSFTLEDEHRDVKVMAETRIPAGTYEIQFRMVGGLHSKYSNRFAGIHKGMLELQDVPNFQYILIHCGNTEEDTAGCLLVGYDPKREKENNYAVYHSTLAYYEVYPHIANHLHNGGTVSITITDYDEIPKQLG